MGADMRRRSLVVESFLPTVRAEARQIQNPMDTQRILEVSPLLLACQYAMVREWVAANKPGPSRTHPSFVEWSRVIGGIIEHAGFACPIPVLTVAPDVDPVTASMERLVTEMRQENQPLGFTFREVVNLCKEHELFEDVVPSESAERKGNTEFGRLLKRYDHREFVDGWFFRIHGMGHAKRYSVVQQLEEAANPEPNQPEAQALAEPGPAEQTTTVATVDAEPPTLENSAQPQEQPLAA